MGYLLIFVILLIWLAVFFLGILSLHYDCSGIGIEKELLHIEYKRKKKITIPIDMITKVIVFWINPWTDGLLVYTRQNKHSSVKIIVVGDKINQKQRFTQGLKMVKLAELCKVYIFRWHHFWKMEQHK